MDDTFNFERPTWDKLMTKKKWTPPKEHSGELYEAILNDDVNRAKALIHAGADLNVIGKLDRSYLHHVKSYEMFDALVGQGILITNQTLYVACAPWGIVDLVQWLIDYGIPVDGIVDPHSRKLLTPLKCAAMYGNAAATEILLKNGADPNVACIPGVWSALNYAVSNAKVRDVINPLNRRMDQYEDVVKMLLAAGANIEFQDNEGKTPLLRAVRNGNPAMIKVLLEGGANLYAVDLNNRDALSLANHISQFGAQATETINLIKAEMLKSPMKIDPETGEIIV